MVTLHSALLRGVLLLGVTPVAVIIGAPLTVAAVSAAAGIERDAAAMATGIAFGFSFVMGWMWWSWRAPDWRLWALANVTDADAATILRRATQLGLLWRPGHVFERTELRGPRYSRQLAAAELAGIVRRAGPHRSTHPSAAYWNELGDKLNARADDGLPSEQLTAVLRSAHEHLDVLGPEANRAQDLIRILTTQSANRFAA